MKHLNANLDNTTNIEVPSVDAIRVLGLDADNNVVEISGGTTGLGGGGESTGDPIDMDANDITDMTGDGSGVGSGDTLCYTLTGDLDPCYLVGSRVEITRRSGTGVDTVTSEVTSITTTPGMVPTNDGDQADCDGLVEGDPVPGDATYYEFVVDSVRLPTQSFAWPNVDNRVINWTDWPFTFPNGRSEFEFQYQQYDPIDQEPLYDVGYSHYGRFTIGYHSSFDSISTTLNSLANGSSAEGPEGLGEEVYTYRKVGRIRSHPAPQIWIYTSGFYETAIYPTLVGGAPRPIGRPGDGQTVRQVVDAYVADVRANTDQTFFVNHPNIFTWTDAPANTTLTKVNGGSFTSTGVGTWPAGTCATGGNFDAITTGSQQATPDSHEICVEVIDVLNPSGDAFDLTSVTGTGSGFTITPYCANDDIPTDEPQDPIDTRECTNVSRGDGIILYSDNVTTEITTGTLGTVGFDVNTLNLDVTNLPGLSAITTSTTLTDVTDGSITLSNSDDSIRATFGYGSAALNGNTLTLAGNAVTLLDQPVTFNIFNSSFPHPDSIAVASIVGEINTTTEFTLTSGTIAGGTGPFFVTELILFGNAISAVRVATTAGGTPLSGVVTTAGSAAGTTDISTIGNLTQTNAQGKWGDASVVQVCDNNTGGDGNFGGDLGVGGDATFNGNVKIPTLTDNTIPVKADNDCLVDSAITSVAGTAGVAESGTDGELRQYLGGGVTLPLTVALTAGDTLADLATLGNTLFSGAGAEGDQNTFAEVVQLFQLQVQQASFTGTGYFRLGPSFADNDGVILFDIDPATTGDPTGYEQADFVVRDTVSFEWNPAVGSMYGGGIDYVPAQAGIAASATVTGDLTVTGTVTGTLNNTNTASPTPFQFWAGTQTEFDNQYGTHDMACLLYTSPSPRDS